MKKKLHSYEAILSPTATCIIFNKDISTYIIPLVVSDLYRVN
jgi:hypothetical protein